MRTFAGPQSGPFGMATVKLCVPPGPLTVMLPIALRAFWLPTLNGRSHAVLGPAQVRRIGTDGL